MYIIISCFVLLIYLYYKFWDAKKTNERNIKVGEDLFKKKAETFLLNSTKEDKEDFILNHLMYLKQCISVLKLLIVKKEIKNIKKAKILRIITLIHLIGYSRLLNKNINNNENRDILIGEIKNMSFHMNEIGILDNKLNNIYNEYESVYNKKNKGILLNSEEIELEKFINYYKTYIKIE